MGLDILFSKARKADYDKYLAERQDYERVMDELDEKWSAIGTFDSLSEEQKKQAKEEFGSIPEPVLKDEFIADFRKINFLLPFFGYEDNCSYLEISQEQVDALVRACDKVLDSRDRADDLLPTEGGFFFGGTDYDDSYFEKVERVRDTFKRVSLRNDEVFLMWCWW